MRWLMASACAAVAAASTVATAGAAAYTYAGVVSVGPTAGAAATIVALQAPQVETGHVAAWVGVRGAGGWVQAGVAVPAPGRPMVLYEEIRRPAGYHFVVLGRAEVGAVYRIEVRRVPGQASAWRVVVDGRRRGRDVVLPGGATGEQAQVVAENWRVVPGRCNAFSFRFAAVAVGSSDRSAAFPFRRGVALAHVRGGYVAYGRC